MSEDKHRSVIAWTVSGISRVQSRSAGNAAADAVVLRMPPGLISAHPGVIAHAEALFEAQICEACLPRGSRQEGGDDPGLGEVFHALDSPTATNAGLGGLLSLKHGRGQANHCRSTSSKSSGASLS